MNFVKIGNVANIHGIKGEIKVYPYTDDFDNFLKYKEIYVGENKTKYTVKSSRLHKNMVLFTLDGVSDPNTAETLKTLDIFIDEKNLKKLSKNSYYVKDLIGIEVIDTLKNESIGKITDVLKYAANDVYEIEHDGNKFYIPAIKDVVKTVDILNRKMYVELMEGLI